MTSIRSRFLTPSSAQEILTRPRIFRAFLRAPNQTLSKARNFSVSDVPHAMPLTATRADQCSVASLAAEPALHAATIILRRWPARIWSGPQTILIAGLRIRANSFLTSECRFAFSKHRRVETLLRI